MSAITTHVLDTSRGRPAGAVRIELDRQIGESWKTLGSGLTDANGRCTELLRDIQLEAGTYRLNFNVGAYYRDLKIETFYSIISIVFEVAHPESHYHVPLLISPFGYSTYRGS